MQMLNFYFLLSPKIFRGPSTQGFLPRLIVSLIKGIFQKLEERFINHPHAISQNKTKQNPHKKLLRDVMLFARGKNPPATPALAHTLIVSFFSAVCQSFCFSHRIAHKSKKLLKILAYQIWREIQQLKAQKKEKKRPYEFNKCSPFLYSPRLLPISFSLSLVCL